MQAHRKVKSGSESQIRRVRSNNSRNIVEDLETEKESVISDYEDRLSQYSNNQNDNDLSKSFSSSNRSFQRKTYSTTGSFSPFHSDDPFIVTASNELHSSQSFSNNNSQKRNANILSSVRVNRRANLKASKQLSETSTTTYMDENSMCTSLNEFRQKGNGLFDDEIDDFDADQDEEQDLTAEERALMQKWMHVFQRMLKNRIKEEDAFEYLLEEELSLASFGWNHSATILATISKIYSLKVDRLCSESYHLLASLARGSTKYPPQEMNGEIHPLDPRLTSNEKKRKQGESDVNIESGSFDEFVAMYENGNGDQRQVLKIDRVGSLNRVDIEFDVDPLFRKTSICFDSSSSSGLLLNILPVHSEIVMTLGEIEIESNRTRTTIDNQSSLYDNEGRSMWREIRDAAVGITLRETLDVLPELIDFKITVNAQQQQIENVQSNLKPFIPSIRLLDVRGDRISTNSQMISESMSFREESSEFDRKLMEEIESALAKDVIGDSAMNGVGQSTALKGRETGGDMNDNIFAGSMQTPIHIKLGAEFEDQHSNNFSQMDNYVKKKHFIFDLIRNESHITYFSSESGITQDNDVSFGSLGSSHSPSSGFNSQSLNSSIHKLGQGDKSLMSSVCMNLNWGDPKQWEYSKPSMGRLTKKTKFKASVDGALGAIREDLMEAEDQNDRHSLNNQYNQLTGRSDRMIDFNIDLDNTEDYNAVMKCKKTKKRSKNYKKRKRSLRIRQIKDTNQIQKDHRITTDKVFQIGLRNMKDRIVIRQSSDEGGFFMGDMFDFFERSFTHKEVSDQKEDGYGFEEFGGLDQESARKENRRVSMMGSNITPFTQYSSEELSPDNGRGFEFRTAIKPSTQFFSQTQTAQKRNLKIKELKETVWTCMTASKNSQEYKFALQPLSQFTAKKQSPIGSRQEKSKQRNSTGSIGSAASQTSFTSFVLDEKRGLEGSIKFTDVMTQVATGEYGEQQFTLAQYGVSIQNCFISLLHLANEKALRLIDPSHSESEFFIFEDDQEGQQDRNMEILL